MSVTPIANSLVDAVAAYTVANGKAPGEMRMTKAMFDALLAEVPAVGAYAGRHPQFYGIDIIIDETCQQEIGDQPMDNQHRKISGYRELRQLEIDVMNEIKAEGPRLQALIERLQGLDTDKRWISIGQTHLQQGLMALTRAVAQPSFF